MEELVLGDMMEAAQTAALVRVNAISRRFGLSLAPEECARLLRRRTEALRETERIEFGEGVLPKLALALCDSSYVERETWEQTLGEMLSLFYHFKGACRERLGDDELIAAMTALFNGYAGGCPRRLADLDGAAMLRFAEMGRMEDGDV